MVVVVRCLCACVKGTMMLLIMSVGCGDSGHNFNNGGGDETRENISRGGGDGGRT